VQRADKSLQLLKKYVDKKEKTKVETSDLNGEKILYAVESATDEMQTRQAEIQTLRDKVAFWMPWEGMEEPLSASDFSRDALFLTGTVEIRRLEEFRKFIAELGGELREYGKTDHGVAVLVVLFREEEPGFSEEAKSLGFLEVSLPKEGNTPVAILDSLNRRIAENQLRIAALQKELQTLARQREELGRLADVVASEAQRKKAALGETLDTVYLEGWVRSDRTERLERAVRSVTDLYDLEFRDPLPGEKPPTVTQNNRFVDAFECVTDMFAKPDPNELDPNPVMSFWYWLIFGMMMGDAGYGVVMLGVIGLLIKKMKPKGNALRLFRVLFYTGFSTILWGILFGSYFGFTWNPILLEPMAEPMNMLILSVVVGILHLFSGLLIKAWSNFKKRDFLAVYADSFAWIFLVGGLAMLLLPVTAPIGKWLAILGAASIVLFGGRSAKKVPGKIGLGLYSLYGASGYLGDILSYSRILALAMSSAALAMVMNMLVGMLSSGSVIGVIGGALVFLIGHSFNLGMGLLSAYVHASRLQYIEFFGKFFTGGGIPFRPLERQWNHVDPVNETL
jgi:V/A-type H+-transporting ATPase subunit I